MLYIADLVVEFIEVIILHVLEGFQFLPKYDKKMYILRIHF